MISQSLHYEKISRQHKAYLVTITSDDGPKSYSQAAKHEIWKEAMAQEIKALEVNETWEITILSEGRKVIGCKWVYMIKRKAIGEIEKYKARLVEKGLTQVKGEYFNETFAPVAKMTIARCSLTIAVAKG
ncbi:uncharacterized mitochondrial protein AtMg00820-like [Vicia villosa]|uniref:uncharacterized mitochondrial protein AtMg00820-like n=1 Tax=Vicia villosa TaxID=3911 RepID=UPI00273B7E8E|nr:uncharacterized mitochondrial protein AtMg00820-like [Vicia villosa]